MRTPPGCVKWGRGNEQGAHGEHGGAPPGVPDRRRVGRGGPDQSNPPVRRPRGAWTRAQVSGGGRRPFSSIGTNTETATSTYEGGSGHALVARMDKPESGSTPRVGPSAVATAKARPSKAGNAIPMNGEKPYRIKEVGSELLILVSGRGASQPFDRPPLESQAHHPRVLYTSAFCILSENKYRGLEKRIDGRRVAPLSLSASPPSSPPCRRVPGIPRRLSRSSRESPDTSSKQLSSWPR